MFRGPVMKVGFSVLTSSARKNQFPATPQFTLICIFAPFVARLALAITGIAYLDLIKQANALPEDNEMNLYIAIHDPGYR